MATFNGLPLYNMSFDENFIPSMQLAIVDFPAIEVNFMAFAKEKRKVLMAADEEKRIVFGAAMIPDLPIYREDGEGMGYYITFSKETIAQVASAFSQEKAQIVVLNGTETPGLAATKQEDMQYEGFKISMIGNTPDDFGEVPTTIIYKQTDSKPQTLDELKKYFGVEESGNAPESLAEFTEDADFIVVLGDDQFASAQ